MKIRGVLEKITGKKTDSVGGGFLKSSTYVL